VQANGAVSTNDNEGLIEKTTDVDVFSFSTNQGGNVALSIMPSAISPNLNIKARLLDANGNQILVSDPSGTLVATLMGTVGQGTFYVEIDGVGDGANPSVGYSDYNSMGPYSIGGSVPPNAVTTDCNNDIGGTASVDNCGVCAGGNTGITPNTTCTVDCNNVMNGTAFIDGCNICVGGNTGKTASVSTIPTGFILLGNEGETKTLPSTSDVIYGIPCKFIYQYGVSGSIAINNGTFGDPAPGVGKKAYYKPIGTVDCNGVAGGTASVDNCGVCSGGNTGLVANTSCTDCNNVVNGAASIDNCNVCSGGNTGIIANSSCNTDCNGDANGTAFIDGCNICVGGNTGKSKIVNGIPDGYVLLGNEGDTKTLPTKSDVVYGHDCRFTYLYGVTGSVAINNGTFGDPAPGQVKKAYYKPTGVVTSIHEQTTVSSLNIYPNPVRYQVTIDGEFSSWILTDSRGAFIKIGTDKVIDVRALSTGLYYLNIDGEIRKIIKI
jgi:hypothetical protein